MSGKKTKKTKAPKKNALKIQKLSAKAMAKVQGGLVAEGGGFDEAERRRRTPSCCTPYC